MAGLILVAFCASMLVITWRGMRRLWRGQLLRLTAALMRRSLPLEQSLAIVGATGVDFGKEERYAADLAGRLERGMDLPLALQKMKVISRSDAVTLSIAMNNGRAPEMLDLLAGAATVNEKRGGQARAMLAYPLILSAVLLSQTLFLFTFVMPKYEQMIREMEINFMMPDIYAVCIGVGLALGVFVLFVFSLLVAKPFWYFVPGMGTHFRMEEQARFMRSLGVLLAAGTPLERAIDEMVQANASMLLGRSLRKLDAALEQGTPVVDAFRASGAWRPEVLWAVESVSRGAPAGPIFNTVADVLDDKAERRILGLQRVCTPAAVLIAGSAVATLAYVVFMTLAQIAQGIM